jgi:branched-chain amino acid transport system permease protein
MSVLINQFVDFTIAGLVAGCLYALVAFGYTIVYRVLRIFNFAHGGTFMVATIGAYFVARWLNVEPEQGFLIGSLLFIATTAGAVVVGIAVSMGLEYALFRPIRKRRGGGLPVLVAGLAAITVMQEMVALFVGRDPIAVPSPLSGERLFGFLGGSLYPRQLLVLAVSILAILAIEFYVERSRMGRAIRAVGQDATTATLMGISSEVVFKLGFILAGATAGLAASLSNAYYGSTSWLVGFDMGIAGITAALLGGMGSIMGALVGGLALGLLESYGGAIFGAQWQDVIAFVALVALLLLRPRGIVGERATVVRA